MFRVVDVFDVAENFIRIDRVSLFLALVLSSFERSFSARLRNEIVDMDLVVLTRGLALSNCAVVFIVCLWNAFFPPKTSSFYREKMGIYVYLFVKRIKEKYG